MNSKGIQPYIYTYPFSSKPHSRPGWYITLSRVLCTIQQVLLGYPFWIWQWVCDLPNIVILILKTQKEGEGLFFSYLITIITIIRLHSAACGILLPWPGIKPMPPALSVQSLNHWITREVPMCLHFMKQAAKAWRNQLYIAEITGNVSIIGMLFQYLASCIQCYVTLNVFVPQHLSFLLQNTILTRDKESQKLDLRPLYTLSYAC